MNDVNVFTRIRFGLEVGRPEYTEFSSAVIVINLVLYSRPFYFLVQRADMLCFM